MKRVLLFLAAVYVMIMTVCLVAAVVGHSQQAPAPQSAPAPSLSTADRVAIQSLEKTKADAAKLYQDAQQQELAILREWQAAHPGWLIDQQTFAITAEKKPDGAKPETKK